MTANTSESANEAPRLIRLPAALGMVGLGRTAWLDLVREGRAPRPIKIGRATAWVESELADWLREQIRNRRAG
jgi:prophage regulatory protein